MTVESRVPTAFIVSADGQQARLPLGAWSRTTGDTSTLPASGVA